MRTLSLSETKMKFSSLIEQVQGTDEEIVITRNGSPAAVLISHDEYESLKETSAILSDAALMDEIRKGVSTLQGGKANLYTLDELVNG